MRFHILAVPHTISVPEYSSCAFTQKVVKMCKLLMQRGHYVVHYGHEDSEVECSEHVTVTTKADLEMSYPDHDWRVKGWPTFSWTDPVYRAFNANCIGELQKHKQSGDFLLCMFGDAHKAIADMHSDLIVVEPGIGYPNGAFAKYKCFESYAVMHAYQGTNKVQWASNDFWYSVVIPNYFDLDEFKYSTHKLDYFLFLGRVNDGKGAHIAQQIADVAKTKLIMAGMYDGNNENINKSKNVRLVGVVGPEKRKKLLSRARAILCPSTFLEPFCGVQIEAMLSGTPVISSDWGAFAEYNVHGLTGYRCRTFEHFEWAANNIGNIKPADCREWAKRLSLDKVGAMYDEFFMSVKDVSDGKGWYGKHPERKSLTDTVFNAQP